MNKLLQIEQEMELFGLLSLTYNFLSLYYRRMRDSLKALDLIEKVGFVF